MAPASNSLAWVFDVFEGEETYLSKPMFGCLAAYVDGLLCLVAADRGAPWDGLLVCTSQDRHAALVEELPALRRHPVLGKWLYVPESDPEFEHTARRTTALVLARDERIGVEPRPRRRGGAAALPKASRTGKRADAAQEKIPLSKPLGLGDPDDGQGRALDPFTGKRGKAVKGRGRR